MSGVFDLTGRSALVTGAGSDTGIGFATARLLGEMGASVLVSSTTERIHDRVDELRAIGIDAIGLPGDLTDPSTALRLVTAASEQWGGLDVVVHNAGMTSVSQPEFQAGTIDEMDFATWRAGLSRNLDTAFLTAKVCLPSMMNRGWGRVVFVASVTGPLMAMAGEPAYAAAKAGMVGLARALARDSASRGVTVNAIAPGWIATGSQTPFEHAQGRATPLGRSASPDEVASAIGWLASPGASYITGQCLVVDGGNSICEERA
ncbi:MAG: SDR family oxidoreductase [Acidobacteria bacterium]|nr:SDR family oxidoreductase [Acidobacteriota bacterium]